MLTIRCHFHPGYQAADKPAQDCETCRLLYVLAHHQGVRDQRKALVELGSKLAATVGNDEWEEPLTCFETGRPSDLNVRCRCHQYRATRKPGWKCGACWLLFVLKFQNHEEGESRLGPFNPYAYAIDFVDLRKACAGLKVA